MRLNVYSVFDRASGVYDRPWCAHSDKAAVRALTDQIHAGESTLSRHPDDFTLFRIGTWTDDSGLLKGEAPEKVVNGAEVLVQNQEPPELKEVD